MLYSLSVTNYILIGSLETTFPEGLVIISGETGAGKSILLGALSLVLGAKADASMVGPDGDHCVVEAEFGVDEDVRRILEEADLPADEDRLVLRRTVARSGRSRSFAGDEPVSLGVLQALSERLVDIHSQHQSLLLGDERFRREALDLWAGCTALQSQCADAWKALQEARRKLEALQQRRLQAQAQQEYNQAQWEKLHEARLEAGEWETLEAEQSSLAHAEEIKETLCAVEQLLSPDGDEARPAPSRQLREAARQLEKAVRFIPSLSPLTGRLESARLEVEDIAAEVAGVNSRTEASPLRLEQVESRLSLLHGLMQRYGVGSVEELIAERDRLEGLLEDALSLGDEEKQAQRAVESCQAAHARLSEELHQHRSQEAGAFAQAVMQLLERLELSQSRFQVELEPCEAGAFGQDHVRFLFSSGNTPLTDIGRSASGGELSRIMLALKAVMARFRHMPTLLFDEIDTGVSGSAADKMGSLVCEMGADMQVFAITHLPQVAAKGHAHYLVSKTDGRSSIRCLDAEGRVQELARMLSGSAITPAAVANARALLQS